MEIIKIDWDYLRSILEMYAVVGVLCVATVEWMKQLWNVPEKYKGWAYPALSFAVIAVSVIGLHAAMPDVTFSWGLVRQMAVGIVGTWLTTTGIVKRSNRLADRAAGESMNKQKA